MGGDPREHRESYRERETGKEEKLTKVLMSRQLGPIPWGLQ